MLILLISLSWLLWLAARENGITLARMLVGIRLDARVARNEIVVDR
jgi:hypothetical protein